MKILSYLFFPIFLFSSSIENDLNINVEKTLQSFNKNLTNKKKKTNDDFNLKKENLEKKFNELLKKANLKKENIVFEDLKDEEKKLYAIKKQEKELKKLNLLLKKDDKQIEKTFSLEDLKTKINNIKKESHLYNKQENFDSNSSQTKNIKNEDILIVNKDIKRIYKNNIGYMFININKNYFYIILKEIFSKNELIKLKKESNYYEIEKRVHSFLISYRKIFKISVVEFNNNSIIIKTELEIDNIHGLRNYTNEQIKNNINNLLDYIEQSIKEKF